jgi:hypothetical protein
MALTAYQPWTAFPGKIGRTVADSSPAWPEPNRAKPGYFCPTPVCVKFVAELSG